MATLSETQEQPSKGGDVVAITTESRESRYGNGEAYDSDECILPPRVQVRDNISVKKEPTVVREDV
jgi:hypothetical protein